MRAVRVTVTMKDGSTHFHEQTYRSGHWRNPLSDEVLKDKFRDLAGRVLTASAVNEIDAIIDNLENEESPAARLGAALQQTR